MAPMYCRALTKSRPSKRMPVSDIFLESVLTNANPNPAGRLPFFPRRLKPPNGVVS